MRQSLYHGAVRWFPVQLLGLTGKTIAEQRFVLEEDGSVANVYDYTRARAGATAPQWIRSLSPESPAISYQYPENEKNHFGAASLCKLLVATDDPRASRLHRLSIPTEYDLTYPPELLGQIAAFLHTAAQGMSLTGWSGPVSGAGLHVTTLLNAAWDSFHACPDGFGEYERRELADLRKALGLPPS